MKPLQGNLDFFLIRASRGHTHTHTHTHTLTGKYYEALYANKLDNLCEIDEFLDTHKLPKLTKE